MSQVAIIGHTEITIDEEGIHLTRDDGKELPPAPSPEKTQEALQHMGGALMAVQGKRENKELCPKYNLIALMDVAEAEIRAAIEALQTP